MELTKNQCNELIESFAAELVMNMEKTAGLGTASVKNVVKDFGRNISGKAVREAETAEQAAFKGMKGAKKGSGFTASEDWMNKNKALQSAKKERNYTRASTGAQVAIGAGVGVGIHAHNKNKAIKEAAELLIEAVLYKQAATADIDDAVLVAEASEAALNYLGYTKLA